MLLLPIPGVQQLRQPGEALTNRFPFVVGPALKQTSSAWQP